MVRSEVPGPQPCPLAECDVHFLAVAFPLRGLMSVDDFEVADTGSQIVRQNSTLGGMPD